VTDQVIRDHLQGRHVVGICPLLTDETCWLIAADVVKGSWTDDVLVFAETCRMIEVPSAVERSRSGHGAHYGTLGTTEKSVFRGIQRYCLSGDRRSWRR
jgi:hypothetical protein